MLELADILQFLDSLKFRTTLGVAGSYARGSAKTRSDIDIVSDSDMLTLEELEFISKAVKNRFNKNCDIIQLPLLKKEDEELDAYAASRGLGHNDHSVYKNIVKEVVWCEQVI